ncbi:MAG TPA: methyltransferase domain-containing protein [Gaiellaceae bacterium]|nr:methyltransferase domain-containing protein [Gaiellaceae bacterium]
MREQEDAYGRLLLDHLEGRPAQEIVERDDGFIAANQGPAAYFAPYGSWPSVERRAMRYVRGRVLDVGCGAGRAALRLQERGHELVAVDISPLAVEVARRRGVLDAREVPFERVDASLGIFDTVLMLGNNFGLVGSAGGARRALRRLHGLTSARGRVVAESNDPSRTDDPAHLGYQKRNRERGRLPGHLRLRVRHRELATPWFDYLIVSPADLEALADGTGWRPHRLIRDEGSLYVAVLEKA